MYCIVASATLISSTFGFLLAIFAAYLLSFPVDLISLSEALPFLVITVGFDKPFLLARAVFNNPEIAPVRAPLAAAVPDLSGEKFIAKAKAALEKKERARKADGSFSQEDSTPQPNGFANDLDLSALDRELAVHARIQREIAEAKDRSIRWAAPVGAKFIVSDAVSKVGVGIVRDYAIEIAVLCLGGASGIGGLKEFCHLAALILAMDCLCLFTFYVAILTVMVEVYRIKIARKLTPSSRKHSTFDAPTSTATPSAGLMPVSPTKEAKPSAFALLLKPAEWKNALIGQKGSVLNENVNDLAKKRSPAGTLKLTLVSGRELIRECDSNLTLNAHLILSDCCLSGPPRCQSLHALDGAYSYQSCRSSSRTRSYKRRLGLDSQARLDIRSERQNRAGSLSRHPCHRDRP